MNNPTNGNPRIEFLKKREQEIRAQIAVELAKSRRRADRETARAVQLVGEAVIHMATENPGFKQTIAQVLNASVLDERARDLLRRKGLL